MFPRPRAKSPRDSSQDRARVNIVTKLSTNAISPMRFRTIACMEACTAWFRVCQKEMSRKEMTPIPSQPTNRKRYDFPTISPTISPMNARIRTRNRFV
jgi:hypothetical protein